MSIEAMKQALEALTAHADIGIKSDKAITALRAAIEQAEKQEPVAWLYVNADMPTNRQLEWTEARQGYAGNWLKYPLYVAPPAAQKPVAYRWKGELFTPNEIEMLDVDDAVPLYQNPEPVECMCGICKLGKREWVGLTEADIRSIDTSEFWEDYTPMDFARVIETKLKELNT
jgi:hypothetical protein